MLDRRGRTQFPRFSLQGIIPHPWPSSKLSMRPVWFFCSPLEVVEGWRPCFPEWRPCFPGWGLCFPGQGLCFLGPASSALSRGCNIFPWTSPGAKPWFFFMVDFLRLQWQGVGWGGEPQRLGWISMAWSAAVRNESVFTHYLLHSFQNTQKSQS